MSNILSTLLFSSKVSINASKGNLLQTSTTTTFSKMQQIIFCVNTKKKPQQSHALTMKGAFVPKTRIELVQVLSLLVFETSASTNSATSARKKRSEERRVGKECRSR